MRNRDTQSGYRGGRSRGRGFLGGLLIMLCLGAGSFAFGFLAIHPLMNLISSVRGKSPEPAPSRNTSSETISSNTDANRAPQPPVRQAEAKPSGNPAVMPSIEPTEKDNIQHPASVDNPGGTPAPTPAPPDNTKRTDTQTPGSPQEPAKPAENAIPPTPSPSNATPAPEGTIQRPGTLDGGTPATATPTGAEKTASPDKTSQEADTGGGYYRVQTGVYTTPEAADEAAKPARDKSIATTIAKYESEGKTLYRVQYGVYKNRKNAEKALQTLKDAGISASIVRPTR